MFNKIVIAAIAAGLWANAAVHFFNHPAQARAAGDDLALTNEELGTVAISTIKLKQDLESIARDTQKISDGNCLNSKLCPTK
jgi:hypothetical protein